MAMIGKCNRNVQVREGTECLGPSTALRLADSLGVPDGAECTNLLHKHEVVLDRRIGKIDKAKQKLSGTAVSPFRYHGIPFFIQIIAEYGAAFESYFSWFDSIDNKTAFLMDSSIPTVLAHACRYVTNVGLGPPCDLQLD